MDNLTSLEELSVQLDSSMTVQPIGNQAIVEEPKDHPRISLYKNRGRALDQERRWRQALQCLSRTKNRSQIFDSNRNLPDSPSTEDQTRNPWSSKPSNFQSSTWRSHSNHLMLSEWLLFIPDSLSSDYLMKFCPKGRHVLVVASKGSTKVFSRIGRLLLTTKCALPGGGLRQSARQNKIYCSVLDCIMSSQSTGDENMSTDQVTATHHFHVLDLIQFRETCYDGLPFKERCYWLESFLKDQIEACPDETYSDKYRLDGILFYHQSGMYEAGATPLVSWLKPYMLPEWFPQLQIHQSYLVDMPAEYISYKEEIRIQEATAKNSRKK